MLFLVAFYMWLVPPAEDKDDNTWAVLTI